MHILTSLDVALWDFIVVVGVLPGHVAPLGATLYQPRCDTTLLFFGWPGVMNEESDRGDAQLSDKPAGRESALVAGGEEWGSDI